ncbi:MAG TPA: glycosyltransferase [Humisphaera sp.]
MRAAVVQEDPDDPTPGRAALLAAGVPVVALPPIGTCDPADAVAELLERIDADPPAAVVFWNLVQSYKVLLADLLVGAGAPRVVDVSPGEMYFTALDRYFATARPGLPYRTPREYGGRLAAAVVKFGAEADAARAALGCDVAVVPNGVVVPAAFPARPPNDGRPLVIGTAARLSPQKRLEDLLAAVRLAHRSLPPYVLQIAGGPDGPDNEAYAADLRTHAEGLPVEWLGEVADAGPFLAGLDLFAMISEPAGCPNASLEAMAAALPVVATDVGGAAEQVVDGVTGRLVPRGDVSALAAALVDAVADCARLAAWGRAGWQRARERFSVERMADDYERVLGLCGARERANDEKTVHAGV